MSWRYENAGTADTLIIAGTTLTDLPESKSKTGTAFYQTTRAKCFDLPATPEIWIKFNVYFNGSNRWRAYNDGSNGTTGITAQTTGDLSFFINDNNVQQSTGICKKNQLQTVLLHMISDSSAGIVEAWVDGNFIYRYTGDVNHGEDFADIYLQSDGAGTFFSNVVISDEVPFFYIDADTECTITNATWTPQKNLAVWLPFDESTTKDLCGNTWTAYGDHTISDGTLQLNGTNQYLALDGGITLGGKDFTICAEVNLSSAAGSWVHIINLWTNSNTDANKIALVRNNNAAQCKGVFFDTNTSYFNFSVNAVHHIEFDYVHADSRVYIFVDGSLATTLNKSIAQTTFPNLWLGRSNFSDPYFLGTIDNLMIYDGVPLHTQDFTPPTNADYLQLRLAMGLPAFEFDADVECEVLNASSFSSAVCFSGNDDDEQYAKLPASVVQALNSTTAFTFEFKFATNDTRTGSDASNCYALLYYNNNSLLFENSLTLSLENGSPWVRTSYKNVFLRPSIKLNDGQIHQLSMVKDGTTLSLYADGALIASKSGFNMNFANLTRELLLCATIFRNYFLQMDLYELRVWNIARAQEDLFAYIDGTEQGLVAWYLPLIGETDIIPDKTGNDRHVTLYGSPKVACNFGYYSIETVATHKLILVEDNHFNLTGSAFYSADLNLPPMPEVWIEFSVYNRDLDGWQVGNDHDNFTGIAGETPDTQNTSTPLTFKAYNLNSVISNDTGGLTKEVQTFLMHMIAGDTNGLIEVWIDGVSHYTYQGNVNDGNPFDKLFLHSSGATCFQSFRISNTEFPSTQIIILDFDVEALVVNEAFSWSVDETHVERHWAPPGGSYPPNFIDVIVHDRTAWYQTVVTKAFDLPPTYHLWIDFDVYFDGVHHWRAGNIGSAGLCGVTSGNPLSGFSNGVQVYPTTNLLQAAGDYEWTPVLVHLQSGTNDGIVEAWFNGDKVFEYTGNVNDGEPFADPVLQSDGAGTYFSYLLFSTNPLEPRRNVDTIELCLLRNGQVLTYPLYAYETCDAPALAVRYDGRNWYNVLRDPSDELASDFYIKHAESTYALTKG